MSTIDKISTLLKEQKKTQKDLMDHLGLEKSTFTTWKSEKNKSYKKHIKEIAQFLGVTTDYLLDEETNQLFSGTDKLAESVKQISNNELSFALFGTADIDEEVLNDVRKYAEIARRMREEQKKEG